jgi:hypothetical protein
VVQSLVSQHWWVRKISCSLMSCNDQVFIEEVIEHCCELLEKQLQACVLIAYDTSLDKIGKLHQPPYLRVEFSY